MNTKTVEDCFYQIRNGANIKQGIIDGGYPITRIETIANDRFNRDRMGYAGIIDLAKYESYVLDDGDILMSHINSTQYLGRAVLYKKHGDEIIIHGMNLLGLKANRDVVNPAYAGYYFNSPIFRKQIHKITKKSVNQASFTVADLKKLNILVPSLSVQSKIVKILDAIEYVLELHEKELQKFDELVKSRFVEMFGMPGKDEKGWGLRKLGECCVLNPRKATDDRLVSGLEVSFVPMTAVSENGEIELSETRKYDDVKSGFTYFADGDVLFAKITPCMENGKGAVAENLKNEIGFGSTEFHVLRPIEELSNPYWLYTTISFEFFRIDAATNMTGSAGQRRVPAQYLDSFMVSLPPIKLQNEFENFVKQTYKSKVAIQKSLKELKTLKQALMQQYFG